MLEIPECKNILILKEIFVKIEKKIFYIYDIENIYISSGTVTTALVLQFVLCKTALCRKLEYNIVVP